MAQIVAFHRVDTHRLQFDSGENVQSLANLRVVTQLVLAFGLVLLMLVGIGLLGLSGIYKENDRQEAADLLSARGAVLRAGIRLLGTEHWNRAGAQGDYADGRCDPAERLAGGRDIDRGAFHGRAGALAS
ncbi:hypothetical protein [Paraburkholderia kururiensis]|uniref:hypothetical protein n=1 Tax=Paraburkholderia kururiensis TaxID=984307 RepID=UPI0014706743